MTLYVYEEMLKTCVRCYAALARKRESESNSQMQRERENESKRERDDNLMLPSCIDNDDDNDDNELNPVRWTYF